MPICRRCEAQANETWALDDDPLVDSVDHVGLLLYQVGLLPGFGQGVEPLRRAAGRQVPDRLRPHDLQFAAKARHPREVLSVVEARCGVLQGELAHLAFEVPPAPAAAAAVPLDAEPGGVWSGRPPEQAAASVPALADAARESRPARSRGPRAGRAPVPRRTYPILAFNGLHELFGTAQVVPGTSAFSWQWAPDVTITADADVLSAGQGNRWVMTPLAFIDWATLQVEREKKSRVLRVRWNKEATASKRRLPGA